MFKLKLSKLNKQHILDELNLEESKEYTYVITDDSLLCENQKINIVIDETMLKETSKALDLIVRGTDIKIKGLNEFGEKQCNSRNILYFITEEETVYGVLSNTRIRVDYKLYELEELLYEKGFVRVSKYSLVNIEHIDYIKKALNSKLDLLMSNKELLEVNRTYLKGFKEYLK